jgi:hypothetical protein
VFATALRITVVVAIVVVVILVVVVLIVRVACFANVTKTVPPTFWTLNGA